MTGAWGDGINLSGGGNNIKIVNSTVNQAARQGIAVTNASNVTINDDRVLAAHRFGIDIEPYAGTDRVNGIAITNSYVCGNIGPIAGVSHWGVTGVFLWNDIYCFGAPVGK